MYIFLLDLFFAVFLRIASLIFVAKMFTFALFVCCRFFSNSIPRYYRCSPRAIYFLLRAGLDIFVQLDKAICFVVLLLDFVSFFANFVSSYFVVFWAWVDTLVCPWFAFFVCLPVCFLASYLPEHISPA